MTEVGLALMRTVKTLGRRRVWVLLLWPAAVALLIWVGLTLFLLEWLVASLVEVPPMTWLAGWGAVWLAKFGAVLGGWLLVLAAAFVDDEWRLLRRQHSLPLLLLGVTLALLAHVPVFGLLAPTLAALAYVHYCLEALRALRQGAVVTVIGELPTVKEAI